MYVHLGESTGNDEKTGLKQKQGVLLFLKIFFVSSLRVMKYVLRK